MRSLLVSRLQYALLAVSLSAPQFAISAEPATEVPADTGIGLLPKTTVTATRIEDAADAVPATVSVIDAKQIQDELATDVKDLVRYEPGVAVRNNPARFTAAGSSTGRDRNSGFNIRGIEGNRILILVDGVRVPDAFTFGAQSVGRGDYVELDLLKSVEILRGPSSALYGSDGLAGAVSFVTKDPDDLLDENANWGVSSRVGYASADESLSEGLALAGRAGRWQGLLAYTRRDSSEQGNQGTNDSANVTRTTPNPQDLAANAALGKLIFAPNESHRLRLTLDHLDQRTDSNVLSAIAVPPLTATSTLGLTARDDIKRDRVSIDHRHHGQSSWLDTAQTELYYQTGRTTEFAVEDRNTAADRIRDNTFDNKVLGLSSQLTSLFAVGNSSQQLVYGFDVSQTSQEGLRDGTIPPAGESYPTSAFPESESILAGVYLQDEIRLLDDRLALYPALRYDYYSIDPQPDPLFGSSVPQEQDGTHLSPKFGAVVTITDAISAFVNYGEGFKAPSPSQVNTGFTNPVQNYRSISNPDLSPETSESLEAGLRFRAARFNSSVTGFSGRYRDFIDQVQVGGNFSPTSPAVFQYVNRGRVRIDGAEMRAAADLGAGFTTQLAASYAYGTSTTNGVDAPLNSIEPWKLVTGVTWHNASQLFGGQLIATHSAGKEASRVDQAACSAPSCFTPSSFTTADILAWWNVTESLTVRAGVFNLADSKYWWWSDVRGQPSTSTVLDAYTQPGRNASASLTWRF